MKKDNLVIIMADQLRYDVLSPELTPNIWSIKSDGIEFTRAYTACPLCVPSRGAFFTGTYPNRNGSLINPWVEEDKAHGDVREGFDNLYRMMSSEWDVIHSGKQHLFTAGGKLEDREGFPVRFAATEKTYHEFLKMNGRRNPGGARFKTPVPEMVGGRKTRLARYSNPSVGCYEEGAEYFYDCYYADRAVDALKTRDRSRPLFLSAMFVAPHPPLDIPEPWFSAVSYDDFTLPENVGRFYSFQSPLQMYNLTGVIGGGYRRDEWKESWRVYLGLVRLLDDQVGRILSELKSQGLYDESLIIFTSDHGEMLGSHSLYQKMCMYEESSHVPLYMKLPSSCSASEKAYDGLVSLIDIVPTLKDYLGFESMNGFDGISLRPYIEGRADCVHDTLFMQYDGNGSRSNFQRAVLRGNYKLILDMFKDEYFIELYDTVNDREEKENLIFLSDGYDDLAYEMLGSLRAFMEETGDLIAMPDIDISIFRKEHISIPAKPELKK
mgnify:CR=1 FL=1